VKRVNRKIIILGAAVAALLLVSHAALAFGPAGGMGMQVDGSEAECAGGFWGDLELSSSQAAAIEALKKEFILEKAPLVTELRLRLTEVWRLRVEEEADPAAREAKRQEVQDLKKELQALGEAHREDLMEVLTPEQRAVLESRSPGGCFGRGGMGRLAKRS
jgi:Spy/CpxP family protein refolding chaperone